MRIIHGIPYNAVWVETGAGPGYEAANLILQVDVKHQPVQQFTIHLGPETNIVVAATEHALNMSAAIPLREPDENIDYEGLPEHLWKHNAEACRRAFHQLLLQLHQGTVKVFVWPDLGEVHHVIPTPYHRERIIRAVSAAAWVRLIKQAKLSIRQIPRVLRTYVVPEMV